MVPVTGIEPVRDCSHGILSGANCSDFTATWRNLEEPRDTKKSNNISSFCLQQRKLFRAAGNFYFLEKF